MKYYLLISLLIIFGSCKSSPNEPFVVTNIVVNTNDIKPNLATKIKNIMVMNIDTNALIGEITAMEMDNDYIYMLDAFRAKKIFILKRSDGKLKNIIAKHGNSNSEYLSITSFQVDSKTKDIYILDSSKKMIKRYNSSGKFINNVKVPFLAQDLLLNEDGTMWVDKGDHIVDKSGKSLALIDYNTGEVISNYYDIPDHNKNIGIVPYKSLFKVDSLVTYLPSMSKTIYSIGEDITPKYHFDFGGKWPSKNSLKAFAASPSPAMLKEWDGCVLFLNYLESAEWLHINFQIDGQLLGYFFNKESQEGELYNLEGLGRPLYIENNNTFVFLKYTEDNTSLAFVAL